MKTESLIKLLKKYWFIIIFIIIILFIIVSALITNSNYVCNNEYEKNGVLIKENVQYYPFIKRLIVDSQYTFDENNMDEAVDYYDEEKNKIKSLSEIKGYTSDINNQKNVVSIQSTYLFKKIDIENAKKLEIDDLMNSKDLKEYYSNLGYTCN